MDEKIREKIDELNAVMKGLPYGLALVDPKEVKLLDKNARYMSADMFKSLVENVRRDGGLTSLPLLWKREDGSLLALSGNHRVQAAVHAGVESILALVLDRPLSREEQVAIQLSHNAIEGKDDPVVLKDLWDEIEDIDLKLYAGLDSELLKELEKMEFDSIAEARLDFRQVMLLFLPEEAGELKRVMEDADNIFSGDENYILSRKHFNEVFALLADVKEQFGIVNNPTAMMKLVELAREKMEEYNRANLINEGG
ncbi:MAG: ParB N-terminal domain-containing protein [Thermodesulfovibrionales bacterium]|nr:ParB N-terminal domain-containing protein [Thermodesulfovibrionales bacterium]